MDAAAGLLYVGSGQYYDPTTGRFLTRDVKPNNSNPYMPRDPTGAIIAPLGVVALLFGRKKKGSKWGTWLVLLVVLGSVGMTLAACGSAPAGSTVEATVIPIGSNQAQVTLSVNGTSQPPVIVTTPAPPNAVVTALCATAPTETPIPTPTGTPIPTGSVPLDPVWGANLKELFDQYKKVDNSFTIIDFTILVLSGEFDPIVENSQYGDLGFR